MLMVSTAVMAQQASKVYLTREISPESLVKIYKALGVEAKGRVAVKMSTGEGSNPNYLKPELVKNLILEVDGTIVECNTAYSSGAGNEQDDRNSSANHWRVIERHGFLKYFPVDIMDEYDEIRIPVKDQSHIKYDIVGGHMANYDFMIALNHFYGWLRWCVEEPLHRLRQSARQGLHPLGWQDGKVGYGQAVDTGVHR